MNDETSRMKPKAPTPVRLPDDLKERAKLLADEKNISLSALICQAVSEKVERLGTKSMHQSDEVLAKKVGTIESKIDLLSDSSFLKSRGEVIAYMDELKTSMNRLDASISVGKLTREEVLDAITIIAKYTPKIEEQYEQFSERLAAKSKAQEEAFERFILAVDESENGVRNALLIWKQFVEAFGSTESAVAQWQKKLRASEAEFALASQKMLDFQTQVERELVTIRQSFQGNLLRYFGGAFATVLLTVLVLVLAKYWGLFS